MENASSVDRARAISLVCLVFMLSCAGAGAARNGFEDSLDRALGTHGALTVWLTETPPLPGAWRASVEVGERVHGTAGLRTAYARLAFDRRSGGTALSATVLSSPVGGQWNVALESYVATRPRLLLALRVAAAAVNIDALESLREVRLGMQGAARLTRTLAVAYDVGGFRLGREPTETLDAGIVVSLDVGPRAVLLCRYQIRAPGRTSWGGSAVWRIAKRLRAAFGYTDASDAIDIAITVGHAPLELRAGVTHHPFLGLSKSIFLRWQVGR